MIKRLWIDNFKAFNEQEVYLNPFNVIVGNNASGKSSLLLALSFLSNITREDFAAFLQSRQLKVENIRSKITPKKPRIKFIVDFELPINGIEKKLCWGVYLQANSEKNTLELSEEWVQDNNESDNNIDYLRYKPSKSIFERRKPDGTNEQITDFTYTSSILKFINSDTDSSDFPELAAIKKYFDNSNSFELLEPFEMRKSSRGISDTIGEKGSHLASFIKGLSVQKHKNMTDKIKQLSNSITDVATKSSGMGWVALTANEEFSKTTMKLSASDLSDGSLRIIAFAAISEISTKNGFVLLDEIENGINKQKTEALLNMLKKYADTFNKQLFITTHSTVFVDYVNPEEIIYTFRDKSTGEVNIIPLFSVESMKNELEYLYPGEVLLNLTESEIISRLLEKDV